MMLVICSCVPHSVKVWADSRGRLWIARLYRPGVPVVRMLASGAASSVLRKMLAWPNIGGPPSLV
jgi:hypothetical protein